MTMLLSLCLQVALAADFKPAGKVEIEGVVEVPLYAGPTGTDPFWYVQAMVGEKALLLRLATGHDKLILGKASASTAGIKVTGEEGKEKARAKDVAIGAMHLRNVEVTIGNPEGGFKKFVDGELGLGGASSYAFAILPSEGKVRFAPAEQGASLVSAVGPAQSYRSLDGGKKLKVGESEFKTQPETYIIEATVSGVTLSAELVSQIADVTLARELTAARWFDVRGAEMPRADLPPVPERVDGEASYERRPVGLGGVTLDTDVLRAGYGVEYPYRAPGQLGMDVLGRFDLAVDPERRTLALRPIAGSKAADVGAVIEAQLRKDLDPPAAKEEDKAPDPSKERKRKATALSKLRSFLVAVKRDEEAVAVAKEAAEQEPDNCEHWVNYGGDLLGLGRADEAADAFQRAGDLYGPWAARGFRERRILTEKYDDRGDDPWDGPIPQSNTCHVAWSGLAYARLVKRDYDGVTALYPAKLDLDEDLALAAGNAYLFQKNYDAAESAFRQAAKLTEGSWPSGAREGLFLAARRASPKQALAQFEGLNDPLSAVTDVALFVWNDVLAEVSGPAEAAARLARAADVNVEHADLQIEAARAARRAGNEAEAVARLDRAVAATRARLVWFPRDFAAWSALTHALVYAGKLEEAETAVAEAAKLAPNAPETLLAQADVADARGNVDDGNKLRHRAGAAFVSRPSYAMLLLRGRSDADLTAPPPPPPPPPVPVPEPVPAPAPPAPEKK